MTLAIDPGEVSGWALFSDQTLVHCGVHSRRTLPVKLDIDRAIIERPLYRPHERVNPNDLITLALNAGEHAGRLQAHGVFEISYVEPHVWKGGSIPKDISHARIFAKLEHAEKQIICAAGLMMAKGKQHNMLDAVGIGLFMVGRKA